MVKLVNRAKMTVASGGAGDITLGTAVDGYQTFADAGVLDTNVVRYTIEDGDNWEIGTGVYTASGTTLVRTVTESSNSNAALTCSADAVIFVTLSAEDFSGNAAPAWSTTPPSTINLKPDGSTAVTLASVAVDEFPVRYSWDGFSGTSLYDADSLPPQLSSAPTFSGGTASLIGSSAQGNAGSFFFRIKATDGVKTATAITRVFLTFLPSVTSGLLGLYDASSYGGSGSTTWSDTSGNSGPDLTLSSNVTFNSSGIGTQPSFNFSGVNDITYSGSAFTTSNSSASIFAVFQSDSTTDLQIYFGKNTSGTDHFGFASVSGGSDSILSGFSGARITSGTSTDTGVVYVNKVDFTQKNRGEMATAILGTKMASVVVQTADLNAGISFPQNRVTSTTQVPTGEIRFLLIYNRALTSTEITSLHTWAKSFYPSSSHMPA